MLSPQIFVEKVEELPGKHIAPMHAEHLIHHAHMVIARWTTEVRRLKR
jgi:hypothetical protein